MLTAQTPPHERRVLFLVFGATSSMVLGVSTVMPMIPSLARIFDVSQTTASLAITMFTLPGILFALVAGMLADRFGRRAVLVPSLFLFAFAGAGCAFVDENSFHMLLALRFVQGIGAASLGVLNTTIIADMWSGQRMASLVGLNTTVLNICTALYPSIGGVLAYFDWRYPFLLSLLALPAAFLALATPLANPGTAGTFRHYLSDVGRIFQTRKIMGLLAITGVTFIVLYGPIITCFPVLADTVFQASPAVIGGCMIFSSFGAAISASQLGRLYTRFSSRGMLLFSQVLYLAAMVMIIRFPSLLWMLFPIFIFGFGQGLNIPNVQAQLLNAASPTQRAAVMSVNGMLLRLGQTLAPVGLSSVMAAFGVEWGFYAGMLLACVIVALVCVYVPRPGKGPEITSSSA
ncbi:MAG: Bacillibactin exporter [Desulfovibrio sp.]